MQNKNLDLRYVGNIMGQPMYIDVTSVPNIEVQTMPTKITERDRKTILVRTVLQRIFSNTRQKPLPRQITVHIDTMLFTPQGGYKRLKKTFKPSSITPKNKFIVNLGRTNEPNTIEVLLEEEELYDA